MASYVITKHYTTTTRGINGSDEMPGTSESVTRTRWPDAATIFRGHVWDATHAQGMLDTRAGHDADRNAKLATLQPMKLRDYDKVVNIGNIRIRLRRVS